MKKLGLVLIVVLFSLGCLFAVSDERLEEIAVELNVPSSAIENLISVYNPSPKNEDENIVRVSFSQYLYDYRTNMVEADRKYKGKELEIYNCYGVDMSQAMMHRSCDYYVVSGDWRNDTVLIYVDRADNHLIPEVLDNYFTIRGHQSSSGYEFLENCRIIQIGYLSET